jgi:Cytochrome c/c1 heme lyase
MTTSPQRKGGEDALLVAQHDELNDRVWREILAFEALHATQCPCGPNLMRVSSGAQATQNDTQQNLAFVPTPKARMLRTLGFAQPIDRQDWIVDRCGSQVRYAVDFYDHNSDANDGAGWGFGQAEQSRVLETMHVDARPALGAPSAIRDRVRFFFGSLFGVPRLPDPDLAFSSHIHHRGLDDHHGDDGRDELERRGPAKHGETDPKRPHPPAPGGAVKR